MINHFVFVPKTSSSAYNLDLNSKNLLVKAHGVVSTGNENL
jgi:hypothetical protein